MFRSMGVYGGHMYSALLWKELLGGYFEYSVVEGEHFVWGSIALLENELKDYALQGFWYYCLLDFSHKIIVFISLRTDRSILKPILYALWKLGICVHVMICMPDDFFTTVKHQENDINRHCKYRRANYIAITYDFSLAAQGQNFTTAKTISEGSTSTGALGDLTTADLVTGNCVYLVIDPLCCLMSSLSEEKWGGLNCLFSSIIVVCLSHVHES